MRVHAHRDRDVFIFANGDLKKIADCRIQPYRIQSQGDTSETGHRVQLELNSDVLKGNESEKDLSDPKPSKERMEGPKTRSRSKSENEARKDVIGAFWLTKQNSE